MGIIDRYGNEAVSVGLGFGISDSRSSLNGGEMDAFRHAYTSAVVAYDYTSFTSLALGKLNEYLGDLRGQHSLDRNMDDFNNAVGRAIGARASSRDEIGRAVFDALKRGQLITNKTDERAYSYTAKCFSASTPILCATGVKPIADIRVGDIVLAFSPERGDARGALQPRRVKRLFRNVTNEWLKVTPAPGHEAAAARGGFTELVVTPGHRILGPDGEFRQIERHDRGDSHATFQTARST